MRLNIDAIGENTYSVSDIISFADAVMYVQKCGYHIQKAKLRLHKAENFVPEKFEFNKDNLYNALVESADDYIFIGSLKTGEFMYSKSDDNFINYRLFFCLCIYFNCFFGHNNKKTGKEFAYE